MLTDSTSAAFVKLPLVAVVFKNTRAFVYTTEMMDLSPEFYSSSLLFFYGVQESWLALYLLDIVSYVKKRIYSHATVAGFFFMEY